MKLELKKLKEDNKKSEMTLFLHQCLRAERLEPNDNMTTADWDVLSSLIEKNLSNINRRLEAMKANEKTPYQPQTQTPAPAAAPEETTLLNDGDDGSNMNANGVDETIRPPFGDYANPQL